MTPIITGPRNGEQASPAVNIVDYPLRLLTNSTAFFTNTSVCDDHVRTRRGRSAMTEMSAGAVAPTAEELDQMHVRYRQGGQERQRAPHILYPEDSCPHHDCDRPMHAIDFRLEEYGRAVHDPLVRAWWNDIGFV